jgi:hypothetical protein
MATLNERPDIWKNQILSPKNNLDTRIRPLLHVKDFRWQSRIWDAPYRRGHKRFPNDEGSECTRYFENPPLDRNNPSQFWLIF